MSNLISRDDAIRELNGACSNWEDDAKVQEIIMAIPSTKPIGDLISREDAIEAVCDVVMNEFNTSATWGYDVAEKALSALPSAEQVTGKLNNPCDSLLKADSDECKEQKSKLESAEVAPKIDHDRDWIIGCLKHDGFIKTDRFDKANQIILEALTDRPTGSWISEIDTGTWMLKCSVCGCRVQEEKYRIAV